MKKNRETLTLSTIENYINTITEHVQEVIIKKRQISFKSITRNIPIKKMWNTIKKFHKREILSVILNFSTNSKQSTTNRLMTKNNFNLFSTQIMITSSNLNMKSNEKNTITNRKYHNILEHKKPLLKQRIYVLIQWSKTYLIQ